ncbi:MAG TPA: flagellar assembly protein FliW [Ignavibacteriaceae bacterium]|jgi:flagellar assembly factor FliW|nr:flagellar assembly protein FliW [Ignavibacteriaceae bacterium]
MKINTRQFGEIEFSPELMINFSTGIFGFENLKNYLLIKVDDDFFYWLNSVEEPEIAFPLVGVRVIDDKYPLENEHEAFGIVTMNPDILNISINLKAPVYINQTNKTGFQKILDSEKYPVNYNLFKEE